MINAADILNKALNEGGILEHQDNGGLKPVAPDALTNKITGLYFSAHWCPPCRGLTPLLGDKYREIIAAGHPFEIIFVSADNDENGAVEYFKSHPWKMLSFDSADVNAELNDLFDISGIPTLVLLDEQFNLLSTDGVKIVMTTPFDKFKSYEADKRALAGGAADIITPLLGTDIMDADGHAVAQEALANKITGLYFSAHWCPPCRRLTPMLAEKYRELIAAGHPFEIIFVSSDRSEADALEYFKQHPWKMLNFARRDQKAALSDRFDVEGIPTLILLDENWRVLTAEGIQAVMTLPFERFRTFEEDKQAEIRLLNEKISSLPESVTHAAHPHPLIKTPQVYRGSYGCNICGEGGSGWVYHCAQCQYDAHPRCACPAEYH